MVDSASTAAHGEPFRFFDNREKYLLFVTTTSEKSVVAKRVGDELELLEPSPPALRIFDAGTGNGMVLANVLRDLHCRLPSVPMVVVGKEFSMEDMRMTLATLPDRLAEHPETVVVLTNMFYAEAPELYPRKLEIQRRLRWWDVGLTGTTSHDFHRQVIDLERVLTEGWQTRPSPISGNPIYDVPSVLVLYRGDRAFALDQVIPRNIGAPQPFGYDLVLAAQPYRSRTPAEPKVRAVLVPLSKALNPKGRLVVVQSTGDDPGMEIVRRIWPDDDPFATPRNLLITELDRQLNGDAREFSFEHHDDDQSLFTYDLLAMPNEIATKLSTSTALAAWNAAVYVAQVEDERVAEAMQHADYLRVTNEVVLEHGGLWFQDESFVVVRR